MSDSLQLSSPRHSPGQNTGVGSLSLLQGISPTQGWNPGLPHYRWIPYQLSHKGSPKNTGVGSLSLLQQVFPTQESNWGLLNCRCIIYQLSYQVSLTKEQQLLLVAIKSLYYYKHGATGWPVLILTNPWRREEKSVWSRWEAL